MNHPNADSKHKARLIASILPFFAANPDRAFASLNKMSPQGLRGFFDRSGSHDISQKRACRGRKNKPLRRKYHTYNPIEEDLKHGLLPA